MPDDRLEKARFVRVSKTGDLVFSLGGREMAVSVDDTLERAILEAKQVRSEMRQAPQPHQQSTLPISQIQSLIRAGADPARVAEKYHLSEMLVRRFSMAVETEKQYAIELPPVDLSTSISPATNQAHDATAPSPVSSQTAGSVPCRGGTQRQQGAHHQRTGGTHAGLCGNRHGISDLEIHPTWT